jgi:hypothetical protein
MRTNDAELELFHREVSCAALLERWPAGWRRDLRESTHHALAGGTRRVPPRAMCLIWCSISIQV